jgi:hypothetical protein
MREVSRIVIGRTALRLVQNADVRWCEKFEAGDWVIFTPEMLSRESFDERIKLWLNENYATTENNYHLMPAEQIASARTKGAGN